MGKARKVNYGVVAGIFVVALFGWLVVSNYFSSGDLAGEAFATTGQDINVVQKKYFDLGNPIQYESANFAGVEFSAVASSGKINARQIAAVSFYTSATSTFESFNYKTCASTRYWSTSASLSTGQAACLRYGFSGQYRYAKFANTGNNNMKIELLKLQVCGNSVIEGTEQCDDGNTVDTDACSNSCVIQQPDFRFADVHWRNYPDTTPVTSATSDSKPQLVWNYENAGERTIEPAGVNSKVTLKKDGSVETYYTLILEYDSGPLAPGQKSPGAMEPIKLSEGVTSIPAGRYCVDLELDTTNVLSESNEQNNVINNAACIDIVAPTAVCGNSVIEGTEQCDDGNTIDKDACSNSCTIPLSCRDSDVDETSPVFQINSGLNVYIKGTVTDVNGLSKTDYCADTNSIYEAKCNDQGMGVYQNILCDTSRGEYCQDGKCLPEPSCSNGLHDRYENGVDCGGSCAACLP